MAKTSAKELYENKTFSVEVILSKEVLDNNEALKSKYDSKRKILTFNVNQGISNEISEELKQFLSGPVVGSDQIVLFNPLVDAINKLQDLKDSKYEPLLSAELESELIEKCFLDHLSLEVDTTTYIFDFKEDVLKGKKEDEVEQMRSRTEAEIDKFREKQHKASHQVFKDAKKLVGSFNTSIKSAKKEIKQPYIDTGRKIDGVFKLLAQESDNTKNALETNFKDCLDKEQHKKDEAALKKKEAELKKIEQLSEQNKSQQELIDKQNLSTKIAQIKNNIEYTKIGGISTTVAGNALNWNLEGLNKKKEELANMTFDNLCEGLETNLLSPEEINEMKEKFNKASEYWFGILDREVKLREEKATADANQVKLETIQKQTPTFQDDDTPPFETIQESPKLEEDTSVMSDDDKFALLVNKLHVYQQEGDELTEFISKMEFTDEFYLKKRKVVIDNSLKQINEWNKKLADWAENNRIKYINFKNQNK